MNDKKESANNENEEVVNVPIEQHRKEMIEGKENRNGVFSGNNNKDARVIDENEFKEKRPDLYNWLVDHWGDGVSDYCVFIHKSLDDENDLVRVKLYTNENMYSIKTMLGRDKDYMDCVAQSRKCEVGEDWHRGRDLSDGKYDPSTFKRIMRDILEREFLEVNVSTE